MKKILASLLVVVFAASVACAASIHVGEVGKVIQYFPNPQPPARPAANPVSLTGLTVVMKIQQPGGSVITDAMTVSGDGTNATYSTVSTDFPVLGNYALQWFASSGSTLLLKSDQVVIYVGASL